MEMENNVIETIAEEAAENYEMVPTDDCIVLDGEGYEIVDEEDYNKRYANGMVVGALLTLAAGGAVFGIKKLVTKIKQKNADKKAAAEAKERMNEALAAQKASEIDYVEGDEVDPEE